MTAQRSLTAFINQVISEGVKSALHQKALQEKEKQLKASGGSSDAPADDENSVDSLFGADAPEGGEGADKPETKEEPAKQEEPAQDDTKELETGEITAGNIIDKLNTIRSGKSFKDNVVSSNMNAYVEKLSKAEKTALLSLLKGIAAICTGEVAPQQASKPEDHPSDVKMTKGHDQNMKSKTIKPNVIKAPEPKKVVAGGTEDTAAPASAPITAKKRG